MCFIFQKIYYLVWFGVKIFSLQRKNWANFHLVWVEIDSVVKESCYLNKPVKARQPITKMLALSTATLVWAGTLSALEPSKK